MFVPFDRSYSYNHRFQNCIIGIVVIFRTMVADYLFCPGWSVQEGDTEVTRSQILFIPKGVSRIGRGGFDALEADREQCDEQSDRCRRNKYPYSQIHPIGVTLEPFVHGIKRDGPGDHIGHQHPLCEFSV